jgi:hypothetical protein
MFVMHFCQAHGKKIVYRAFFLYRAPRSTTCSAAAAKQAISRDENAEMEEPQSVGLR